MQVGKCMPVSARPQESPKEMERECVLCCGPSNHTGRLRESVLDAPLAVLVDAFNAQATAQ